MAAGETSSGWFRDETVLMSTLRAGRCGAAGRIPQISGYDEVRELSRGGQGVVFTAVQRSTKRKVAIKLLLDGALASEARRRRFEREVDLAASLRHPHIVRLYDSGVTVDGNPYYVMDYIEGEPLDRLIEAGSARASSSLADAEGGAGRGGAGLALRGSHERVAGVRPGAEGAGAKPLLAVRAAVELFVRICDSVNYAHQRGVIHRDLKPSNIRIDRDGMPHVLDFGLAKRTFESRIGVDGASGAVSLTGEFLGSLPWASPEQAEGDPDAIDVRTDVYALGVMLHQTLTGGFPYEVRGPMGAVLRTIQSAQPARPSRLRSDVGDELDSIVLKCLEKRPEDRYQTVSDLGRDLRRYLAGEPIEAKQASAWYTLRKSLWRYRAGLGLAAVVALISVSAALATTVQWRRAAAAERLADSRLAAEQRARADEETARRRAQQEKTKARFVTMFLVDTLGTPSTEGREARIADRLDVARAQIDALPDDAEIEAALRDAIGVGYGGVGQYDQADQQLERALELRSGVLGAEHPDTVWTLSHLAWLRRLQGRLEESRELGERVLTARRRAAGDEHVDTAKAHNDLAIVLEELGRQAEAEGHYRAAVGVLSSAPEHAADLRRTQGNLALVLHSRGRLGEAEELLRGVIAAGGDDVTVETLGFKNSLTALLSDMGRSAEAVRLAQDVYDGRRKVLSETHPDTLVALNNLATCVGSCGDLPRAAALSAQAGDALEAALGRNHPRTLTARGNLALWWQRLGRTAEAESLFRTVLAARETVLGAEHPDTLLTMNNLAIMLHESDRRAEAGALYERVLSGCAQRLGAEHPSTLTTMLALAALRREEGRPDEGRRLAERVLGVRERIHGGDDWGCAEARWELAKNDLDCGRAAEAARAMERVVQDARRTRGPQHWLVGVAECTLGKCLLEAGRLDEAERSLRASFETLRAQLGEENRHTTLARERLAELYERTGRPQAAATLRGK